MTNLSTPTSTAGTLIKDLVVQLTGSAEDEHRLAMAKGIAQSFDAHIIGVHMHLLPDILDITDPAQSATIRTLLETSDQAADRSFKIAETRFAQLPVSHELRRLHGLAADIGSDLAAIARNADMFVGTRPYGDPEGHHHIEEEVLFATGRSCVFLPPGGTPHQHFDKIVIAWDRSREAARAVAEAMPFLARATVVRLVHIASPWGDPKEIEKDLAQLVAHLSRHGVQADVVTVPFATNSGEQIEEIAHQQDADLLVMGAYGHTRLVELAFGGATRYVLRHATLPVLMAH